MDGKLLARVGAEGWHVTVLSNLVAADEARLAAARIDNLLAGIHGVTPDTYAAFHPGWDEREFFTMCRVLRRLRDAGTQVRHVHVIMRDNAHELVEMVQLVRDAEVALTEIYQPHGINVGINLGRPAGAGVVDHVHIHLVPRWTGDTNFMSVIGSVRVLPEELPESARRLRPAFDRLLQERTASGRAAGAR